VTTKKRHKIKGVDAVDLTSFGSVGMDNSIIEGRNLLGRTNTFALLMRQREARGERRRLE